MIYYSQIFEWWCILIGAVYLLFVSRRKVLLLIIIGLLCGIVTMLLKDYIVGNIPRPTKLLPLQSYKHILKDVDVYKENYSFPSGHTMLAFSVMSLLASFSKKKIWTIVFFVIALTAGFSRIYLLQHFLVDVYVGACIGVMLTLVVIYFSNKYLRVPDTPFIQKKVRNC
ncbi:MAG: phosphatase PAP2 family protein [Bacteroidales bacterium]|nr:phosphatase PAP2 family protein [Bacteroidales bacterium]